MATGRLSQRKFGVEIECGHRELVAQDIAIRLKKIPELKKWGRTWRYDGSGIEICSPPLQGTKGLAELKQVMELLREWDCYTGNVDGMHVHYDGSDFKKNKDLILILMRSWKNNQNQISWYCADNRMNRSRLIREQHIDIAKDWISRDRLPEMSRYSLNVAALRKHGTIEIRLHEGTLEYEKAEAWIKFGQAFIDCVARTGNIIPRCYSSSRLLEYIKAPPAAVKTYKPIVVKKHVNTSHNW